MSIYARFSRHELMLKSVPLAVFSLIALCLFAGNTWIMYSAGQGGLFWVGVFCDCYSYANFAVAMFQLIMCDPGYCQFEDDVAPEDMQRLKNERRIHHCSVCNRDVYKFNHHCKTIRECVARDSLPYFFKFFCCIYWVLLLQAVESALALIYSQAVFVYGWLIFNAVLLPCVMFLSSILWYEPVCKDRLLIEIHAGSLATGVSLLRNMRNNLGSNWALRILLLGAEMEPECKSRLKNDENGELM